MWRVMSHLEYVLEAVINWLAAEDEGSESLAVRLAVQTSCRLLLILATKFDNQAYKECERYTHATTQCIGKPRLDARRTGGPGLDARSLGFRGVAAGEGRRQAGVQLLQAGLACAAGDGRQQVL